MIVRFVKKNAKKINKGDDVTRCIKFLLKNEGFSYQMIERYLEELQEKN